MNEEICIFCKVVDKSVPVAVVYEDDDIVAFKDIKPVSPHHMLIVPKKHFSSLNDFGPQDVEILGKLLLLAKKLAKDLGIDEQGYRTVINTGNDGGQTVHHLHMHLLGGRFHTWPPG